MRGIGFVLNVYIVALLAIGGILGGAAGFVAGHAVASAKASHEPSLKTFKSWLAIAADATTKHRSECPGRWGEKDSMCVVDAMWFRQAEGIMADPVRFMKDGQGR